jgi:high affinity Mn2+ porin
MRMLGRFGVGGVVATALLAPVTAAAEDGALSHSGFYFGGHVGYGFGGNNATFADPTGLVTSGGKTEYGMLFGGVQAGYQQVFPSRLMLGVEADISFPNSMDLVPVIAYRATGSGTANEQLQYLGTFRGRVGYNVGAWTPFVTAGLAWASTRISRTDLTTGNEDAIPGHWRLGYAVGAGIDYSLKSNWSARLEFRYANLGLTGVPFAAAPARYDSQFDQVSTRIGLNYHFGAPEPEKGPDDTAETRGFGTWELHGQTTFIYQGYPGFYAPYSGTNSLPPGGQARETWTVSAFLGVRLWEGAEFYYNPELFQGFGVADTVGAGGYPNGEAQKSNFPYPRYNTSRLFLRQQFGLGGAREKVEGDYGQLAGERDISRITLQAGKFAVHDLFDANSYAQDPRADFLNWSIWASGAFDYPADRVGLTYGVTAELNQPAWALRAGYFMVGNEPNANVFDMDVPARGGYVSELELRLKTFNRPGIARLGLWLTDTFAGAYRNAVNLAAATGMDPNDTIVLTRQGRVKYGYYVNLQQEVNDDVGLFARWSWNDGHTEINAFTDIDRSLSLGAQIKGRWWGRPDDVVGIGGALNMITSDHAAFLAAGGLGVLVGDGRLSYAPEGIAEVYYALKVAKGLTATLDYQFINHPAYNADRGPVHVFSGRLSARF